MLDGDTLRFRGAAAGMHPGACAEGSPSCSQTSDCSTSEDTSFARHQPKAANEYAPEEDAAFIAARYAESYEIWNAFHLVQCTLAGFAMAAFPTAWMLLACSSSICCMLFLGVSRWSLNRMKNQKLARLVFSWLYLVVIGGTCVSQCRI